MKESSESESCAIPEEQTSPKNYKTPLPPIQENKISHIEEKERQEHEEEEEVENLEDDAEEEQESESEVRNRKETLGVDSVTRKHLKTFFKPENLVGYEERRALEKKEKEEREKKKKKKKKKKDKNKKKSPEIRDSQKSKERRKSSTRDEYPSLQDQNPKYKKSSKNAENGAQEVNIMRKKKTYSEKLAELEQKNEVMNWMMMISLVLTLNFYGYMLVMGNVMGIPLTKYVYGMEEDRQQSVIGYFGTSFAIGYLFSNLNMGVFTKYVGRVRTILFMEILKVVIFICLTIKNLNLFLVLRALCGLISGLQAGIVPLTGNEMMPRKIALVGGGMFFFSFTLFMFIGSIMHDIFGGEKGLADNWRLVLTWPVVFCFVTIIAILSTVGFSETPDYYIENVKDEKEMKEKIFNTMKKIYTEDSAKKFIEIKFNEMEKQRRKAQKKNKEIRPMNWSTILSKEYRNQFIRGTLVCLLKELGGNMFLIYFSSQIFEKISGNGSQITVIITVSISVGAGLSLFVIEYGRKKIMLISSIVHAASLMLIMVGVHLKHPLINCIGVFFYIGSLGCGLCSVYGVYMAEIMPAFGLGIAYFLQWVLVACFGTIYPPLMSRISFNQIFGIHLFFAICLCLHINFFCYDTKGMSKEEIQYIFMTGKEKPESSQVSLRSSHKNSEKLARRVSLQGSVGRTAGLRGGVSKGGERRDGLGQLQTARMVPGGQDAGRAELRADENIFGKESERGLIGNQG